MTNILFKVAFYSFGSRLVSRGIDSKFLYSAPIFGLFSVISSLTITENIFGVFILGILWGILLKIIAPLFNEKFDYSLSTLGLLNLLNVFVINKIIDFMICAIGYKLYFWIFFASILSIMFDLSFTLRKM